MFFPRLYDLATPDVIQLPATASVQQALSLMETKALRALIVVSERGYRLLQSKDLVNLHLQKVDFSLPLQQVHLPLVAQLPVDASVEEAIRIISLHQVEQVCLVDDQKRIKGIVSYTDLVRSLDPECLAETQSLAELLRSFQVLQVNQEMPAQVAIALMHQQQVTSLLVSEEAVPLGILTQTDVIRLLRTEEDLSKPVATFMSSPVFTLAADLSIRQALLAIRDQGFKRLVVVDENQKVVGLISQQDLVSLYYNQWLDLFKEQQQALKLAKQQLEQQNQLLALAVDEIAHPALVVRQGKELVFSNQAIEALLGYDRAVLQAKTLPELLSQGQSDLLEQLRLGFSMQQPCELIQASGQQLLINLKVRPLVGATDLALLTFK